MNHEQHIDQMLADGLISENQAQLLRDSVRPPENFPLPSRKNHLWMVVAISIIGLLILSAVLWLTNEPVTVQNIEQTINQSLGGNMNRNFAALMSGALLLIIPLIILAIFYNGIVNKEERTFSSWAQVEAAYQRRADLIPNLVEMVSRYVKHEQTTLEKVTQARADALQQSMNQLLQAGKNSKELLTAQSGKPPVDAEKLAALDKAQQLVGGQMRQLLGVVEAYPQLRASDQFLQLQAQLEGTENRILTARNRFNEAVQSYNAAIRQLPGSLIAGLGNFQRKAYFQAEVDARKSPGVK